MKTFLHYSREKQLEEGILSNIRSGLSSVGSGIQSGMAKIGNVRSSLAKSGFGAMLGQKGGSSADAFAAGTEAAKAAKEERIKDEKEMNIATVGAQTELISAKKALQDAQLKGKDTRLYKIRVRNAEKYLNQIKTAKTPQEFEDIKTKYYAERARTIRSTP